MFTAPRGIILVFRGVKLSSLATRASRITFPRVCLDGNVLFFLFFHFPRRTLIDSFPSFSICHRTLRTRNDCETGEIVDPISSRQYYLALARSFEAAGIRTSWPARLMAGSIPRNNEISTLYGCNCRSCKFDRRPVLIRAISQCPDEFE